MSYSDITTEVVEPKILQITLNRPEKRNPLGASTVAELCHALEAARDDSEVHVVVLTGAGKMFSAGGDLSQMSGAGGEGPKVPPRSFVDLNLLLSKMGKPTIAMVNGHALAGGLGLVVACDLALASEEAKLGTPEVNVGLWPMMIMANIVRNIGRKAALRMMLTGEKLLAPEAARIGLINEAVPAAELRERTFALARTLAEKSPAVLRLGLEAFYATQDVAFAEALPQLEKGLGAVLATEDAREGLMAFLQKRKPVFKGR